MEVVYQLGDLRFGMGPDTEAYLAAIESVCADYNLRLFCINGNHETGSSWIVYGLRRRGRTRTGLSDLSSSRIMCRCFHEVTAGTLAGVHSSPWAERAELIENNPRDWPDASRAYAQDGIDKMTRAVLGVKPLLLAHGHFHVAGEAVVHLPNAQAPTTIWSLAARQDSGTVRVLDLDSLTDGPSA